MALTDSDAQLLYTQQQGMLSGENMSTLILRKDQNYTRIEL